MRSGTSIYHYYYTSASINIFHIRNLQFFVVKWTLLYQGTELEIYHRNNDYAVLKLYLLVILFVVMSK